MKTPIALVPLLIFFLVRATPVAAYCSGASLNNDVWWSGLGHNTFDGTFRSPFEAPSTEQGSMDLRFRTCRNDVSQVRLRVWNERLRQEQWFDLTLEHDGDDAALGPVSFWHLTLPLPSYPTLLYYFFEIRDGSKFTYYHDDDPTQIPGGWGEAAEKGNDRMSFSITVYDASFKVPNWTQGAIIYQIFPDRFRDGDHTNNPQDGIGWLSGRAPRVHPWSQPLCDPRSSPCFNEYGNQFYGGDLRGIIDKLDYIQSLGATAIYLNPIFASPSNHGYDTTNYFEIEPRIGDMSTFRELVAQAKVRNINLILDGVFNHTSTDHPFFDYFSRWNPSLQLASPAAPGTDDGSGACESPTSPYRPWYQLPDIGVPGLTEDRQASLLCPRGPIDERSEVKLTYESWGGFSTLAKLRTDQEAVRLYLYENGVHSVAPYWISQGAMGWRLDVGPEIDSGMVQQPENRFWEGFRRAVKGTHEDTAIIGECWTSIVPFLLGSEWDSSMNYRLRGVLLNWMFDQCAGLGCTEGKSFEDNDNNRFSFSGPIHAIDETTIQCYAQSRMQSSPRVSRHSVVSLLGSHDTNRLNFILKKISGNDQHLADRKQKFLALVIMTTPGSPMLYYGDEVRATADGVWDGTSWQDDPYNRLPFPWADAGYSPDESMLNAYQTLGSIHNSSELLKRGDIGILVANNEDHIIAFRRTIKNENAIVVLNRDSGQSHQVSVPVQGLVPENTTFIDQLSLRQFQVRDGILKVAPVEPLWGMILLPL